MCEWRGAEGKRGTWRSSLAEKARHGPTPHGNHTRRGKGDGSRQTMGKARGQSTAQAFLAYRPNWGGGSPPSEQCMGGLEGKGSLREVVSLVYFHELHAIPLGSRHA